MTTRPPSMLLPSFQKGTTRFVVAIGALAFKFARHRRGARCNRSEATLFRTAKPHRQAMLCPVIWCSESGWILVARRAVPVTHAELTAEGLPDWDYHPDDGVGCPFEPKTSDWGRLDGRLVAVDYAALVDEEDEVEELRRNRKA